MRLTSDDELETRRARSRPELSSDWPSPPGRPGRSRAARARPVVARRRRAEPDYRHTDETRDVRSELTCRCWSAGARGARINLEDTDPAPSTTTTRAWCGRWPTSWAPRCGSRRSTSAGARLPGHRGGAAAALEAKDSYTAEPLALASPQRARRSAALLGMDADRAAHAALRAPPSTTSASSAIPEAILNKPGPLTDGERALIEQHTVIGEQILAPIEFLAGRAAAGAPRPRALGRRRLPRRARRRGHPARRPDHLRLRRLRRDDHRPPLPHGAAPRGPRRAAAARGTQFDPAVVDALSSLDERVRGRRS